MDFELSEYQKALAEGIRKVCARAASASRGPGPRAQDRGSGL